MAENEGIGQNENQQNQEQQTDVTVETNDNSADVGFFNQSNPHFNSNAQVDVNTQSEENSSNENQNNDDEHYHAPIEINNNEDEYDVVDLDDKLAFDYLKKTHGIEFDSLEDFLKGREVVKEVNIYEEILDEDDKQYLNFKKETGRSRKDFEFLNQDFDALDPIDLARQRIEKETGVKFTIEQAKEYLEDKFDIDLSDEQLSVKAQIELKSFTKPVKDELNALKETYRKPIEKQNNSAAQTEQPEMVRLTDGSMMTKADYAVLMENHQKHIKASIDSVNSVAGTSFKTVFDDNGTPRELSFNYDYSNEDKQRMLSIVSDVDGYMSKTYRSENGEFQHQNFAEDMGWSNRQFREKAIATLVNKARAEAIEEVMKSDNNVSFNKNQMPTNGGNGNQRVVPVVKQNGIGFPELFLNNPKN